MPKLHQCLGILFFLFVLIRYLTKILNGFLIAYSYSASGGRIKAFTVTVRVSYPVITKFSKIDLSSHKNEKPLKATYSIRRWPDIRDMQTCQ